MHLRNSDLQLSATDLANFLGCKHCTALDLAVATARREAPPKAEDPLLELLFKRGLEHEKTYVEWLKRQSLDVADLSHIQSLGETDSLVRATTDAMTAGVDVIVQGGLRDGHWFGKPDILRRVARPSALGDWSYEVYDTKLSRTTKAGAILQLSLYSAMIARVQDFQPTRFFVVTPQPASGHLPPDEVSKEVMGPQGMMVLEYRVNDYAAYFRLVRRRMDEAIARGADALAAEHYPDPVEHCAICRWRETCDAKRRADDHISLVAGIGRGHRRELAAMGITTRTQCGQVWPLPEPPKRGSLDTYEAFHRQAALQLASTKDAIRYELKPIVAYRAATETEPAQLDEGLCCLPAPSPGDIFLDFEGDPYAVENGREYLTGIVTIDTGEPLFKGLWAFNDRDERAAYEQLMDLIAERRAKWPEMHVYHYAPYEVSALRKLRLRYESRSAELDRFLTERVFVDLYGVVRQGIRAGVESYSIKKLEPLYGFTRKVELGDATLQRNAIEVALQEGKAPGAEIMQVVLGYNEDDCVSTLRLRDWLEKVRDEHGAIPRPTMPPEVEIKRDEHQVQVEALRPKLLHDVIAPAPLGATDSGRDLYFRDPLSDEERARVRLGYLLDYHRREYLATVWEYWRLRELPEEKLLDEPQAILGLQFVERVSENVDRRTGRKTGVVTDRYTWPQQEMEVERGELRLRDGGTLGKIVGDVDRINRRVHVQKQVKQKDNHPTAVFSFTHVATKKQQESIFRIAERVEQDGGLEVAEGAADLAARRLLLGLRPALKGAPLGEPAGDIVDHLTDAVLRLDHSVLPVQGPPGSGKTFAGAMAICALAAQGYKVGVTANSHAVMRNLLEKVAELSRGAVAIAHKGDEGEGEEFGSAIASLKSNEAVREALDGNTASVVGGTSWLWARGEMSQSVDYLFVDEAGQVSLANVIAMSSCATNIVLLGDPRQLEQPSRAEHPHGAGISALEHAIGGAPTVGPDRGVFLPKTWRMAPSITVFTSEMFYEDRLSSMEGLERQVIGGAATRELAGNGLRATFVAHEGNRSYSTEEVDAVTETVARLASGDVTWTNRDGVERPMTGRDVLVVAPYNSQVSRLIVALQGTGARAGTVDKFQGQEAPVVIYSMASSRAEDAPRGMEFLYNLNRLNVATSRARCVAVVLASAALFEPECRTPRQMKLANALCRYRELTAISTAP